MSSPHELVNPEDLAPPTGFAHAVVPAAGRTVYLGGQTAHDRDGAMPTDDLVEQFDLAAGNVVRALAAAGGRPEHLVSMQIFVTDAATYRARLRELSAPWKAHFGRHYPALALFEVSGLFDPAAKIELMAIAVVPA